MSKRTQTLIQVENYLIYWLVGQGQGHWQDAALWAAEVGEFGEYVLSEANTVPFNAVIESCEVEPKVESKRLDNEVMVDIDSMLAPLTLFDESPFIWVESLVGKVGPEVSRDVALDIEVPSNSHPVVELVCGMGTYVWASSVVKEFEADPSRKLPVISTVWEIVLDNKSTPEDLCADVAEPVAGGTSANSLVPSDCREGSELFQGDIVELYDGVQSSTMESLLAAGFATVGACTVKLKHTGAASWQNTVRLRGPSTVSLSNDKEKE